jgi:acetylglutamate kinase
VPIVVHGAGPQMNAVMDEQNIEPQCAQCLPPRPALRYKSL